MPQAVYSPWSSFPEQQQLPAAAYSLSAFPSVPTNLQSRGGALPPFPQYAAARVNAPAPYIGLWGRLSQSWLNRWTVLLFLIFVRLYIASKSLSSDLAVAKAQALSACSGVESGASVLASLPHYMADGVNELTASSIESAVGALKSGLQLVITGVEETLLFIVNLYKGTYFCLLEMAVGGSLSSAISAAEDIGDWLNSTLATIESGIDSTVDGLNDDLNGIASKIETALKFFDISVDIPTVDIPELSELKNLSIPSSYDTELQKLNSSIPSLEEVKNKTDEVIKIPFEALKTLVSNELGNFTFNRSLMSVPSAETLTFCSENSDIDSFFENLAETVKKAVNTIIAIILVFSLLMILPSTFSEFWGWRKLRMGSSVAARALQMNQPTDPIDTVLTASHPYQALLGGYLASMFATQKNKNIARWFVSYITHPPMLFLLALGLAGLLVCALQAGIVDAIRKGAPELAADVNGFQTLIEQKLLNSSETWANSTNAQINSTQTELNDKLFGWVETSTTAMNDTLNTFVDELTTVLNETFGGTVLYDPIEGVINCLVLVKVAGIQTALTWIHDNAHVTFPTVPPDLFALSSSNSTGNATTSGNSTTSTNSTTISTTTASSSSLLGSSAQTLLADSTDQLGDKMSAVLEDLADKWEKSINFEAKVSGVLVGIYFIMMLAAMIYCLVLAVRKGSEEIGDFAESGEKAGPVVDVRDSTDDSKSIMRERSVEAPMAGPMLDFNFGLDDLINEKDEKSWTVEEKVRDYISKKARDPVSRFSATKSFISRFMRRD
ncbi:plasma membrane fusion protein prm1 [Saitoella coloradoensis]